MIGAINSHYIKDCPGGGTNYMKGAEEIARTNKRLADLVPRGYQKLCLGFRV